MLSLYLFARLIVKGLGYIYLVILQSYIDGRVWIDSNRHLYRNQAIHPILHL